MPTPPAPGPPPGQGAYRPWRPIAAFGLGLVLLAAAAGLSQRAFRAYVEVEHWRSHTYQVIGSLDTFMSSIMAAESDQRTYLLTGDPAYVDPSRASVEAAVSALDQAAALTRDNPRQQANLARLREALEYRAARLERGSELRASGRQEELRKLLERSRVQPVRERVLRAHQAAVAEELELLESRTESLRRARAWAERLDLLLALSAAALLAAAALWVYRDARARAAAQAELRGINRELRQRTLDLESANGELEAFSYTVSHDLRAPLRHLDGYSQLLQAHLEGSLDEKGDRYLRGISGAADQMGLLIDDLLAFSRMGRQELMATKVDLHRLLYEIRHELDPGLARAEPTWIIQDLPAVRGDSAMIKVALANLVSNAVKFSRTRPEPRIEIGCAGREDGAAVIFVRDNGVGFDMAYKHKLFGVFQRLHGKTEFEGTGIGLATVARVAHRHGGRTWAEASLGQGATFYLTLPLYEEAAA